MITVGALAAKTHLALLETVVASEEALTTGHGKPITQWAKADFAAREDVGAARPRRKRMCAGVTPGVDSKVLRQEERR
jgi:hypothetical protein